MISTHHLVQADAAHRAAGPTVLRAYRALLTWLTPLAVSAAAAGFALHVGLQVGISNHCQYLLHGLHAADPTFLANDWFTTQTQDHHALFSLLVRLLQERGFLNVGLGLLNAASSMTFALSIYFILARLTARPLAPYAAAMSLAAFMPVSGPGHSNILLPYFVPSVFAGVALLAAFALLLHDRPLAAGIVAAVGCVVHANYLLLVGPVWVVFIALQPPGRRRMTAYRLLVPWVLAWMPHAAAFAAIATAGEAAGAARRIFWDVYAPLHYRPETWPVRQWTDYLLVLAAGAIALLFNRGRVGPVARRLVLAVGVVVGAGALATLALHSDFVTALYPWRLAPFLTVAAYVCIARLFDGIDAPALRAVAVIAAVSLLALTEIDRRAILLIAAIALLHFAMLWADRILPRRIARVVGGEIHRPVFLLVLLALAALGTRSGLWRQDLFGLREPAAVASLCDWCRTRTPPGTVFVIPPDLAQFRLRTGRAVIVDWKCMPVFPAQQIEWMRRHERQVGRAIRGERDAVLGYAEMTTSRALNLAKEFGCRLIVIDRDRSRGPLRDLPLAFSNERYDVYQLPAETEVTR